MYFGWRSDGLVVGIGHFRRRCAFILLCGIAVMVLPDLLVGDRDWPMASLRCGNGTRCGVAIGVDQARAQCRKSSGPPITVFRCCGIFIGRSLLLEYRTKMIGGHEVIGGVESCSNWHSI